MRLGWKILVPISLVWIVAVSALRVLRVQYGTVSAPVVLLIGAVVLVVAVGVAVLLPDRRPDDEAPAEPTIVSDYPVPPLDLAVPPSPPRRRRAVAPPAKETAAVGSGSEAEGDA
jgi:NADH-quinone oxidoreductase subunit H